MRINTRRIDFDRIKRTVLKYRNTDGDLTPSGARLAATELLLSAIEPANNGNLSAQRDQEIIDQIQRLRATRYLPTPSGIVPIDHDQVVSSLRADIDAVYAGLAQDEAYRETVAATFKLALTAALGVATGGSASAPAIGAALLPAMTWLMDFSEIELNVAGLL